MFIHGQVWRRFFGGHSCAIVLIVLLGIYPSCVGDQGHQISDAEREELVGRWRMYQYDDPGWPAVRDRWYAQGGPAREALVLNLVGDLVRNALHSVRTERGTEPGWRRPQRELLSLGSEGTVTVLVEALRQGRDAVSLEPLSATLAGFGAVDQVILALDHPEEGDSPLFTRMAMKTLVSIGGQKAIGRVALELSTNPDWTVRAAAAESLAKARLSDQRRAAIALLPALDDTDSFVVNRTLDALELLQQVESAPGIASYLQKRQQAGDAEGEERAVMVLKQLTGASIPGDEPGLWMEAAREAATSRSESGAEGAPER